MFCHLYKKRSEHLDNENLIKSWLNFFESESAWWWWWMCLKLITYDCLPGGYVGLCCSVFWAVCHLLCLAKNVFESLEIFGKVFGSFWWVCFLALSKFWLICQIIHLLVGFWCKCFRSCLSFFFLWIIIVFAEMENLRSWTVYS